MSTTIVFRPDGTYGGSYPYGVTGAANMEAAVADNSDGSYITSPPFAAAVLFDTGNHTLPAGARVISATIWTRAAWYTASSNLAAAFQDSAGNIAPYSSYILTSGLVTRYGAPNAFAPDGSLWTQAKLDDLNIRITQLYGNPYVQVAAVGADVIYTDQPTVTVDTPTDPQATSRPTVSWTYTQADGYPQAYAKIRVFEAAVYNTPGFDPGSDAAHAAAAFSAEGSGSFATYTPPADLRNATTYRAYVQAASWPNGVPHFSDWAYREFTVTLDGPGVPTLDAVAEPHAGRVSLAFYGGSNQLSRQDSDFPNAGTGSWAAFGPTQGISRTTTAGQYAHGNGGLAIASLAASNTLTEIVANNVSVVAGRTYTAIGAFKANTTARACHMRILWYSGVTLLSTVDGSTISDDGAGPLTSGFRQAVLTAQAPATANLAIVATVIGASNVGSGEIHFVDQVSFHQGTSTTWTRGGFSNRNLMAADESSFETGTGAWFPGVGTTLAQSSPTSPPNGTHGLSLTAAGTPPAFTAALSPFSTFGVPVVPGASVTGLCSFRKATTTPTTTRQCGIYMLFYGADGLQTGNTTTSLLVTDSSTGWVQANVTGVAPAGAVTVAIGAFVLSPAGSEVHHIDAASISYDPSTQWQVGETRIVKTPVVEYSDDGVTWTPVRGLENVSLGALSSFNLYDHEAPATVRQYRGRVAVVESGINLASDNSVPQGSLLRHDAFWLKDIVDPSRNVTLSVRSFKDSSRETQGRFEPLRAAGADALPVIVGGGLRGKTLELEVDFFTRDDYDAFELIRSGQRTLILTDDVGGSWYVRIGEEVQTDHYNNLDRRSRPYRVSTFSVTQVGRPS